MDAFEITLKKRLKNRNRYLEKEFDILIRCNAIANEYVADVDEYEGIYKEYYGIGINIRRLINRKISKYSLNELVYMLAYMYSYSLNKKKYKHHRRSALELNLWVEQCAITAKTGLEYVCGWSVGGERVMEDLPEWHEIYVPF